MGIKHCFVCGPDNPHGLRIQFRQEGDEVVADYRCTEDYAGWPNVQHGGITAALLDEAAGYIPYYLGLVAMTAKLEVTFHKPILVGESVRVSGRMVKRSSRLIEVVSAITGEDGQRRANSVAKMIILNEKQREELELGELQ
ncbi:PaaI family thioesterase [Ferviditalea candida]|uniref:Acyl-coenzyme A thioesterase THEM4 n=1 Tax=Ferviditalea candida TaxID=3108399 RepID=A0ABU5ZJ79_9BACL|nr:PaaI family thioesterase [Paenibacillaceae bacterium T2]